MFVLLSVFMVHFIAQKNGVANYIIGNAVFVHLGNVSFELFLIHFPVMLLLPNYVEFEMHGMIGLSAVFVISLILAEIFNKIISVRNVISRKNLNH